MKTLMVCLLVISSVVILGNAVEFSGNRKYLDPGVINPCSGSNPPLGCHTPDPEEKTRAPVHEYQRGCSKSQRCRSD